MKLAEVRKRYLAFFKERGHVIIPSAPIVPGNDPTTLFTSSGMQPLLPYFLGKDHPEGKRVVNSQLSFRAGDIEEVGDNRHTTFFEMLGNWSFGDYFKEEQLAWVFEFLTNKEVGLGLNPANIYVSTFSGDEEVQMEADGESIEIWKKIYAQKEIDAKVVHLVTEEEGYRRGMEGGRIFSYGSKKNWWSRAGVPKNMPAGEPGGPDSELFYDFGVILDPSYGPNTHPNSDDGRFIEIGNSVFMQFKKNDDGSFSELPKKNVDFGGGLERLTIATLGVADVFLIDVFDGARQILENESGGIYGKDQKTTRSMRIILDHIRAATFILAEGITPSNTEAGYVLRRLLRRAIREIDRLRISKPILGMLAEEFSKAYADFYPHIQENISSIRNELENEDERFKKTLERGLKQFNWFLRDIKTGVKQLPTSIVFELVTTHGFPFELVEEEATARELVVDKIAFQERMEQHRLQSREGAQQKFAGGLADHEDQTIRYHSTHHILLKALQIVLGDSVKQRGSNITAERLRIDFSFERKMTDEEKQKVENIVNEVIYQNLPIIRTVMPKSEAEKLGAEMEFGVKYPDMVSVYSVGPVHATENNPHIPEAFSLEFCGGPHVQNTQEIYEGNKKFKILKEEASSAGVRRIKAVIE